MWIGQFAICSAMIILLSLPSIQLECQIDVEETESVCVCVFWPFKNIDHLSYNSNHF